MFQPYMAVIRLARKKEENYIVDFRFETSVTKQFGQT